MRVAETIETKLRAALRPSTLTIVDESHLHQGHAGHRPGGESHFRVTIEAAAFAGQGRVARQRMVYKALAEELAGPVHALALDARAPGNDMAPPTLTIRGIRARGAVVPLKHPLPTKVVTLTTAPLVLIDIETNEGIIGRAYGFAYVQHAIAPLRHMLGTIGEMLAGQPLAPARQFDQLLKRLTLLGHEGLAMMAISCFDMAAWDALARAADLPLARLLGGATAPIPAYNSNGLGLGPVEPLGEEARQLLDGGFKAVKLRLGRDRLEDDLAAVRAVRRALPDGIELMTDFNQSLTVNEAIRRGHVLDGEGLSWIEEPVVYDDWAGQARIAAEIATPIQIGENFWGPRGMATALASKACDLAMPDAIRIGGVTGWLRAAALADAARMPMSSHLFPEISAHLLAATPTAHWLEYVDWANPVLLQPLQIRDGQAVIRETPGTGIDWDEDAVRRFAVEA